MITLSLLKYLENNGFGVIDQNLFWEKLGLGKEGLYISDIGAGQSRAARPSTVFEIYSRGSSDTDGYQRLLEVRDFLSRSEGTCRLPSVPPLTDYGYHNVYIAPLSTISNVGVDEEGRVIYSVTGQVYYARDTVAPPPLEGNYLITEDRIALYTEDNKLILLENSNG